MPSYVQLGGGPAAVIPLDDPLGDDDDFETADEAPACPIPRKFLLILQITALLLLSSSLLANARWFKTGLWLFVATCAVLIILLLLDRSCVFCFGKRAASTGFCCPTFCNPSAELASLVTEVAVGSVVCVYSTLKLLESSGPHGFAILEGRERHLYLFLFAVGVCAAAVCYAITLYLLVILGGVLVLMWKERSTPR